MDVPGPCQHTRPTGHPGAHPSLNTNLITISTVFRCPSAHTAWRCPRVRVGVHSGAPNTHWGTADTLRAAVPCTIPTAACPTSHCGTTPFCSTPRHTSASPADSNHTIHPPADHSLRYNTDAPASCHTPTTTTTAAATAASNTTITTPPCHTPAAAAAAADSNITTSDGSHPPPIQPIRHIPAAAAAAAASCYSPAGEADCPSITVIATSPCYTTANQVTSTTTAAAGHPAASPPPYNPTSQPAAAGVTEDITSDQPHSTADVHSSPAGHSTSANTFSSPAATEANTPAQPHPPDTAAHH